VVTVAKETEAMSVLAAVKRDIADISKRGTHGARLAKSGMAATALALAVALDDPSNSATSKSMCAKSLNDTLDRLRELAPPAKEADSLDDLQAKREKRKGRSAASA
jgi:hypothetical protein